MPKMGDAMESGTLTTWRKKNGEKVNTGDIIAEIETDKSNVELEAESAGVLVTMVDPGAEVPVGTVIATIGEASSNGHSMPVVSVAAGENGAKAHESPISLGEAHKGVDYGKPWSATVPHLAASVGSTVTMKYSDAIHMALMEEMDRDPNVFQLGEEIGQYQGTFKITQGMLQKYGAERIVDTPISEIGMVGMATGAAMMGLRPVLEFMTFNFALVAWDQIINHAAKILYMSGGQFNVPLVLRGPAGVGGQLSAQHSQDLVHWYANTPGLKVVTPATPADAKGLLKSAIRDNNPVIFTEHAKLYIMKGEVPEDPNYLVPIGVADVKRKGKDISIITYSRGVILSLAVADRLADEGIDVEVVDVRTLQPIDWETILASVRKTHRAIVVQEQWLDYGIAGEFASKISDEAFDDLDAPVLRVGGAFVPMPYSKVLEELAVPHEDQIIAAVKKTLERSA